MCFPPTTARMASKIKVTGTVVEMDERSEARPLAGQELAEAISMLQYLEERERWNLPVWKDSPST